MSRLMLFTGLANPALAEAVAGQFGFSLGRATVDRFSDGEIAVQIHENVRGLDIFVIQPTSAPADSNLMELLLLVDALRRSSASRITAVIPYLGYARQDRRVRSMRVPISARVVGDMITHAGVSRVLTVDLHSEQVQGFFSVPVDNIYASPLLVEHYRQRSDSLANLVVVSPDIGGVVRARAIAKQLQDADLAIIDKRRAKANESEVMNVIGEVQGRECLLVDDIVDTAGTLCQAAQALKDRGARRVSSFATHAVLSGGAVERIGNSTIDELMVTDTIALDEEARACPVIRTLPLSGLLGEAIGRINREESLSAIFG